MITLTIKNTEETLKISKMNHCFNVHIKFLTKHKQYFWINNSEEYNYSTTAI